MRSSILISVLVVVAQSGAFASDGGGTRANRPTKDSNPAGMKASGPAGYGPLKLGMTRSAVESLPIDAEISLADSLVVYHPKEPEPAGAVTYRAKLGTQMRLAPYDLTLTFKNDRLTSITIDLDEAGFDLVSEQISRKYGAGKQVNNRKDEQCIYRNGSNFTINSGPIYTKWSERTSSGEMYQTSLLDLVVNTCPSDLRYAVVAPIKLKWLKISVEPAPSKQSPNNPF
ncbi:hypothetical protein PCO31111_04511 [Pandoraea communis]|uniref:Lipoprotein n=1 Tax=Pandoraea communis TaxID=2508297 RepID=A0A5E4YF75_9BURK|nr:hypothetical protein [Pandoraea communis]VVE47364.1 hypothetical protein PCO31111_04511 [Pandoraea communis]